MEPNSPEDRAFYEGVKVVRLEASPTNYGSYFLARLTRSNGPAFDEQFMGDPSRGQAAIDHMYAMLLSALQSGRTVDISTSGTKNPAGYVLVTNCIASANRS
jgi:hypothetical protein